MSKQNFFSASADAILSLGKVLLKSSFTSNKSIKRLASKRTSRSIVIMGNGPSLKNALAEDLKKIMNTDRMAVNFAANTPQFFSIKPTHYILVDPLFFKKKDIPYNVTELWDNLKKVDWNMVLLLPAGAKKQMERMKQEGFPLSIEVGYFNMTPAEGLDFVCHPLFKAGLATPRPRNVVIAALMQCIALGYKDIYIIGADHSWPHTLYVDDLNRVVTVQPHFYEDNRKELDRIAKEYSNYRIHDVLASWAVAFRSYHEVKRYADRRGTKIYNATPGSLIDAFTRKPLPDLK